MFAIRETSVNVHGESVNTFSRVVCKEHVLVLVDAGSNGFWGRKVAIPRGDLMWGCYVIRLMSFFDPLRDRQEKIVGVQISGCGDSALAALVASQEFTLAALKDARNGFE